MTTELEQEFFKVFGIEKICTHSIINPERCDHRRMTRCCGCDWLDYPEITDYKLLEVICILNSTNGINCTAYESKNISDLKKEILNECMDISDEKELKAKIQQLFKEGE